MQAGSQIKIPLLLQIDPVFGWTGISFRFPNSWRLTAGEVAEYIDRQIHLVATGQTKARRRNHKRRARIGGSEK